MRAGLILTTVMLTAASATMARGADKDVRRIADAVRVVDESRAAPDRTIPDAVWLKAECVAVFPGLKKGAFIIGGEFGSGVLSCRAAHGWGAPAFLKLEKASWGAQIGAESADLMLLFMNRHGVEKLLGDHVTLGADASLAAGPVGRTGSAATDAQLTAEVVSYSRAHGVFAGIDVSGGVIRPDDHADESLYGRPVTAKDVVLGGTVPAPADARTFITALTDVSRSVAANEHPAR